MKTNMKKNTKNDYKENIYKLDGKVPIGKAILFGLQHVLAMFVSNVTPIIIIAAVAIYNGQAFTVIETARLIQNCMLIAGIATLVQLYPIWKIGARLPIVMGISFTFLAACMASASDDYGYMIGSIIVGGFIEGVLGLTAKYWRKLIQPVVAGCVVISIGFSILNVGVTSYASSAIYEVGSWQNLAVATITLIVCIVVDLLVKGPLKSLSVLAGLVVGYIAALLFGMVDFASMNSTINQLGIFSFPKVFAYTPKFNVGYILSFVIVFLVSAVETIGDTTALCNGVLSRDATDKEISGSLAVDGFFSAVAGEVFGVPPITSFSQNVGLLKMTKVINRFAIMFGALIMIIGGLFPPIGAFLATLPDCVLGGCTVVMFGSIVVAGVEMISKAGFTHRNMIIVAISLCLGIGMTQVDGFLSKLPSIIGDIFGSNMVAGVFVIALILSLVLPKDKESNLNKE